MKNRAFRTVTLAMAITSLAAVAACGSGGSAGSADKAAGPVTIEFWGWAPGYEKSVELFNASHPGIKVTYSKIS
ncbi:ABC transporter substrate-binding protein, partial [Kitasatospora indigofera]